MILTEKLLRREYFTAHSARQSEHNLGILSKIDGPHIDACSVKMIHCLHTIPS